MAQVMTDYTIGVDPKQVFLQSVALQRAEAERRTALERKRNMETDLQSLMAAPSPDAFAQFYLKYPEAKEQVDAYRKTITEADNRTIVETAQEAFMLNRAGKPQEVLNTFDVRIEALRKAGKPELADAAMRARRMYEIAPDQQSRESVLAMTLYNYGGGDVYDKVLKTSIGDLDKDYALNVQLYGKDQADRIRLGQEIAKGTKEASGPAGSTFRWMGPTLNPTAAAGSATGASSAPIGPTAAQRAAAIDFAAARGAVKSMGLEGASAFFKRNNFLVSVNTPAEARELPSGTNILLPDGTEGVVP